MTADYGADGIRCNLVAPGVIRTDMSDAFWDAEPFQRSTQEQTPFNREGTVDDVAATVLFLASEGGTLSTARPSRSTAAGARPSSCAGRRCWPSG